MFPYNNVLIIIYMIAMIDIKKNTIPIIDDITNGTVEKAVIPSNAYLNNFQNDQCVSPATLSTF